MTQSRHFDFGSVARYAALLGLRTAQEPDEIYSAYFNPKVVVKIKPTPASASTLWQVAAAAPLESSWNLAPRLLVGRALKSIARSALDPGWFVVWHVCRPSNALRGRVFFDNPSQ